MYWYLQAFKQAFDYKGRSSRRAYWMFTLWDTLFSFGLMALSALVSDAYPEAFVLSPIYSIVTMFPACALVFRRCHDSDKSGWWMLLPIYNVYLLFVRGTQGDNRFGPDPYGTK